MNCAHCGKWTSEPPHHKKYKSRGGSNDPINMVSLCGRFENDDGNGDCHGKVHREPWLEWTKKYRTSRYQDEGESEADIN